MSLVLSVTMRTAMLLDSDQVRVVRLASAWSGETRRRSCDPQYDDLEQRLAEGPVVAVPTITLDESDALRRLRAFPKLSSKTVIDRGDIMNIVIAGEHMVTRRG